MSENGSGGGSVICHTHRMSDYRKLKVWQKAHSLALSAHRTATRLRGHEHASIRNQITRSAMSVPANLVEGRNQKGDAAFARYVRISVGSASELEYHLLAAHEMGAISKSEHLSLHSQVAEVRMMLHGLLRKLEGPPAEGSRSKAMTP